VIDPRGENHAVTARHRRALGQHVYTLDPFGITNAEDTDRLNPLDLLDPTADDFEDNAAVIATLCIQGLTFKQDPFWDERATALIIAILAHLYATYPRRAHTLRDVQDALREAPMTTPLQTLFCSEDDRPQQSKKQFKVSASEFGVERTRASIFATASSHLGFMRSPAVHGTLRSSTIQLDDITSDVLQTLYVVIPPEKLKSHAKLLRLWIGVVLTAIARRRKAPAVPTLLLIDEAAQLGELDELRAALTLMRGYGVRVWTFWQDLSQIRRTYPADWETILNNSTVQQVFGAQTPPARSQLREYLGPGLPKLPAQGDDLALCMDGAISIVKRPDYRSDPMLKGLAAPNPFYAGINEAEIVPFNHDRR
jgi:type IV secretion system protein VirD4